jgi:hypothetical protein
MPTNNGAATLATGLFTVMGAAQDEALKKKQLQLQNQSRDLELKKAGYMLDDKGAVIPTEEKQQAEGLEKQTKELGAKKLKLDVNQLEKKATPTGIIQGANEGQQQKLGFLTSGLQNLTDYEKEFRKGSRQSYVNPTTPLIGALKSATPIDIARTNMEESLGRLASGGAINAGELKTFTSMIPRPADSDEIAAQKLTTLRRELTTKMRLYGFDPKMLPDLGIDPESIGFDQYANQPSRGLLPTEESKAAQPGLLPQQQKITPEDAAAINWAKQNMKDPRAQQILQMHGVK